MLDVPHSITVPGPAPARGMLDSTVLAAEPHAQRREHEGPGNLCDSWTRFLSHQQGRWIG